MSDASPDLMTIFSEALECTDPAARAAYLDQACGKNADLRRRVEALLAAHDGAGRFLEPELASAPDAALDFTSPVDDSHPSPMTTADYPTRLDAGMVISNRYTLVQKIGEGGMGEVWVAKQTEPVKRKVALKLIKRRGHRHTSRHLFAGRHSLRNAHRPASH